jgi:CheY-like chemotaxis protein
VLERAGYRVLEASRPSEALLAVERHQGELQLLLTDVILPETTGSDLAQHLLRERGGLRVLYTSGYTGGHLAGEEIAASGRAFLPKPFTPEALLRRVREVLDGPPSLPAVKWSIDPFATPS